MKKTQIAVLIGAFAIATAQLFAQAEAPGTSEPRRRIRSVSPVVQPSPPPAAPEPKVTYETRKLAVADIGNIQLDALRGFMLFTVAGVEYEYDPSDGSGDAHSYAAKATACFGLLAELRKAETIIVELSVQLPDWPAERKKVRLLRLVIPIEKLR